MEVSYLGGSSFLLKDERAVVINPEKHGERADISVHSARKVRKKTIVDGPGEYEIGGVMIITAEVAGKLAHAIDLGGLSVVHLDGVPAKLEPAIVEAMGRVDVLILNADDLTAALSTIRILTPRVVMPYGAHAAEICTSLGVDARPGLRWSWNGTGTPPKAVLLKAPSRKRKAA